MGRVVRFLKFWWPSILAGYLAFFTPIGALVSGVVSLLTWALPALAGLIAKNKVLLGGAALFTAGGILPEVFPGLVKDQGDREVDELLEDQSKEETINQLKEEQENRNPLQKGFEFLTGKGKQREDQIYKLETGEDRNYGGFGFSGGNQQQTGIDNNTGTTTESRGEETQKFNQGGVVTGSGNKDTVPAMLTPGEFVMTQGAVKQYGTNIFEGMNAAASSGSVVQNFNQGGVVENPTEKQKLVLKMKNQMAGSQESKTIKTVKKVSLKMEKAMGKNMVPVAVPIKVRSISKTTVLPAIEKQKTSQPTRPGTTVPVFNINSASAAPVASASSDEDDALSYFQKLAEE